MRIGEVPDATWIYILIGLTPLSTLTPPQHPLPPRPLPSTILDCIRLNVQSRNLYRALPLRIIPPTNLPLALPAHLLHMLDYIDVLRPMCLHSFHDRKDVDAVFEQHSTPKQAHRLRTQHCRVAVCVDAEDDVACQNEQ